MTDRRRRILLGAGIAFVLIALTGARILLVDRLADQGWLQTYVDPADRILEGRAPHVADVSPVYLGLVVVSRFLGMSVDAIRAMQIAMLTLAALFCALAAKRLAGWIAAIATAVLILGNRAALVVCSELDPKALVFLLTSAALWTLLRGWNVAAGILFGLAAATHPYGYVLLLIALLWSRSWRFGVAAAIPIVAVIALSPVETHSGTQFYEGNNALASGCAGVTPRVVTELQAQRRWASPDPAYRFIAERAGANPKRYWRDKAFAFIREYPFVALRRFATKALLTIHHFDVYDVGTAQRRGYQLARFPAISFGVSFVLAIWGAGFRPARRRELIVLILFALALILLLTIFVVSARQRNVLLAPLAILGGVGVAEIVALARSRIEHALLAFGAVLIAAALLGIESAPMREYDSLWRSALQPHLFDQAIALGRAGRWRDADVVLASLGGYRPMRQNAAVSSVAYYRARAAIAMSRSPDAFLERAYAEAPGDPHVLALRAATAMDHQAARLLDELHDPLTRDCALRHAFGTLRHSGSSSGAGR